MIHSKKTLEAMFVFFYTYFNPASLITGYLTRGLRGEFGGGYWL